MKILFIVLSVVISTRSLIHIMDKNNKKEVTTTTKFDYKTHSMILLSIIHRMAHNRNLDYLNFCRENMYTEFLRKKREMEWKGTFS